MIFRIRNPEIHNFGTGVGVQAEYIPVIGMAAVDWQVGWWPLKDVKIRLRMEELWIAGGSVFEFYKQNTPEVAKAVAQYIFADLSRRQGFDAWWQEIEPSIQKSIVETWTNEIKDILDGVRS